MSNKNNVEVFVPIGFLEQGNDVKTNQIMASFLSTYAERPSTREAGISIFVDQGPMELMTREAGMSIFISEP